MVICLLSCTSLFVSAKNITLNKTDFKVATQSASNSSVSGNIINPATQNPLQFATVSLVNTDTKTIAGTFESLYNGYFKFTEVPQGNYQLIVTAPGYKTEVSSVIAVFTNDQNLYIGKLFLNAMSDAAAADVK